MFDRTTGEFPEGEKVETTHGVMAAYVDEFGTDRKVVLFVENNGEAFRLQIHSKYPKGREFHHIIPITPEMAALMLNVLEIVKTGQWANFPVPKEQSEDEKCQVSGRT